MGYAAGLRFMGCGLWVLLGVRDGSFRVKVAFGVWSGASLYLPVLCFWRVDII